MNQINEWAQDALNAFNKQDLATLEKSCISVYNHFVHNPEELCTIESPFVIGLAFYYYSMFFKSPDQDINEVCFENAIYLLGRTIVDSEQESTRISAAARCFILAIYHREIAEKLCGGGRNNAAMYLAAYYLSFCLQISIQVMMGAEETKLFNNAMNFFMTIRFNSDPTDNGEIIFHSLMDRIKQEVQSYTQYCNR